MDGRTDRQRDRQLFVDSFEEFVVFLVFRYTFYFLFLLLFRCCKCNFFFFALCFCYCWRITNCLFCYCTPAARILTTKSRMLCFRLFVCGSSSCFYGFFALFFFCLSLYFLGLILVSTQEKHHQSKHTHIPNTICKQHTYICMYNKTTKTVAT